MFFGARRARCECRGFIARRALFTPSPFASSQAEEELIEIVPTFSEGTVSELTGDLGPFTAGIPVVRAHAPACLLTARRALGLARSSVAGAVLPTRGAPPHPSCRRVCERALSAQVVPLWAALRLKADQRCRVVPPHWLTLDFLRRARAEERERADAFTALPFYYVEISRLLLSSWCAGWWRACGRRAHSIHNFLLYMCLVCVGPLSPPRRLPQGARGH